MVLKNRSKEREMKGLGALTEPRTKRPIRRTENFMNEKCGVKIRLYSVENPSTLTQKDQK